MKDESQTARCHAYSKKLYKIGVSEMVVSIGIVIECSWHLR